MSFQPVQRLGTAIKKLVFCVKVSATVTSFLKLVRNTKQFSWSKKNLTFPRKADKPVDYSLTLKGTQRHIYLRTYSGDIQIFYEIFWRSVYSLPGWVFLEAKTIVDIGAHSGMATLFFSLQSPDAILYSVEADERNYNVLLRNLDQEIKHHRVVPIHAAVVDRNEPIYMQRSKLNYNTSVSNSVTDLSVKGINMEQFFKEYGLTTIDILKIDIEGSETFLFSQEALWLQNVKNILIELHSASNINLFEQAVLFHGFRIQKRITAHENIYWAYKLSHDKS